MRDYDMNALCQLVRSAKAVIDGAGAMVITQKGAFDYATQVDVKVQRYLQSALGEGYPQVQFMGEEADCPGLDLDKPTWILDPIDGTTNLIHRFPQSAISLGLMVGRQIMLGIVYNPFLDQMFTAVKGEGAYRDGARIRVSKNATLRDSLISVGTSPYQKERAQRDFAVMGDIFRQCQDIRRVGSAALDLAYVASGVTDGYYERTLKPWDYAAGLIIAQEAGGVVTAMDGSPLPVGQATSVLATNGLIHRAMLGYTQRLL